MYRKFFSLALILIILISKSNATKFEGWFLLLEFEPVYNSPHGESKMSIIRLYFIKDIGAYLNDSIDFNCFMPRNIIRLMSNRNERFNKYDYSKNDNKVREIIKKHFEVNETDSVFKLHYYSMIFFKEELRKKCCRDLKTDDSRKLHFFYGKMEGEYFDEYRELFCDDYLRVIPRYIFFPNEECNQLEYKFSIVLPPPKRILRFNEDFKYNE